MPALIILLLVFTPQFSIAQECDFSYWRTYKGTKIYRHKSHDAYYYVTSHAAVDADGAPNSYHPDDVGKHCTDDIHIGLDCPANAGYPNTGWWSSVLVTDPSNPSKPYVQSDGEYAGFFISKTWLADTSINDSTNVSKYVNSSEVPYIVFPSNDFSKLSGTGYRGDVGFAQHLENGKSVSFIVADQGGGSDAKLGEASISFFEKLGGNNIDPRNGNGVDRGKTRFVVFPNSRKQVNPKWPRTNKSITEQVNTLLSTIGGIAAIDSCPM
ncbi:MAG: hypothetical protein KDJ62_01995 [Rhodobiaceae bacterium]|nr:hypothetical protein [Rhodobiaceae bacterium]